MSRTGVLVLAFAGLVLFLQAAVSGVRQETTRVLVVLSGVETLDGAPSASGNYLREAAYPVMRLGDTGVVEALAQRLVECLVSKVWSEGGDS